MSRWLDNVEERKEKMNRKIAELFSDINSLNGEPSP